MLLFHGGQHGHGGAVQIGKPGVVLLGPVHGLGAEAHDDPQHSGARIHVGEPFVGAVAVAHAGGAGQEVVSVIGAGHPLHQDGHLLVLFVQTPHTAVFQGGIVHGAGVYPPDGLLEGFQPLLGAALVDAEHRLILPGEGIAEAVLQEAGGADNKGILAEVFQDADEPFPDLFGEDTLQKMLPQFLSRGEIALL